MKKDFSPVRGTMDYLPSETQTRESMRQKILECYRKNGFMQIQTPILENLEFLQGSDGGDNLKLMFKTIKRGETLDLSKSNLTESDITSEGLRYDLTVPLTRFFCNNKEILPIPFKSIQLDYSFRAERPQRGRNRQFIQCDVDIIGDTSENAEIEVLTTVLEALANIGFSSVTVKINDKRILNAVILNCGFLPEEIATICVSLDKLDKIEVDGVRSELLQKEFSIGKVEKLMTAIEEIKKTGIDAAVKFGVKAEDISRINKIINVINGLSKYAKAVYEVSIVRGQGYYTGTVFEVYAEGMRGAVAGGGRYDDMVGKFSGTPVPAVGLSIGFEPISILAKEMGLNSNRNKIVLLYDDGADFLSVMDEKKKLMEKYDVSVYKIPKNVRALLEKLKACGIIFYKYFGREEIKEIN